MRRRGGPALVLSSLVLATSAAALPLPPTSVDDAALVRAQAAPRATIVGNSAENARIVTGANERMQVLFADGTAITMGPNSELNIDSFLFDQAAGTAVLSATLLRGVFRFIGGRTSKTPNGANLVTPFGTVAIDQASAEFNLGGEGAPAHVDLIFGGTISLVQNGSVAARVRKSGYSITPNENGRGASVRKTLPEWRNAVLGQLP